MSKLRSHGLGHENVSKKSVEYVDLVEEDEIPQWAGVGNNDHLEPAVI